MGYQEPSGAFKLPEAQRRPPAAAESAGYADTRPNLRVIAGLVAAHVVLLAVLVQTDIVQFDKAERPPLVVALMPERAPPPPPPAEPVVTPIEIALPTMTAPERVVETPAPPVQMAVVDVPAPPPLTVMFAAASAGPAAPGPAPAAADLSSTMIVAEPPRYPLESRRRREHGAVRLMVQLRADGCVDHVSVARSSGFERLDKAALDAVRRWRWSPTTRAGEAMIVRGVVEIPFVLQG